VREHGWQTGDRTVDCTYWSKLIVTISQLLATYWQLKHKAFKIKAQLTCDISTRCMLTTSNSKQRESSRLVDIKLKKIQNQRHCWTSVTYLIFTKYVNPGKRNMIVRKSIKIKKKHINYNKVKITEYTKRNQTQKQ